MPKECALRRNPLLHADSRCGGSACVGLRRLSRLNNQRDGSLHFLPISESTAGYIDRTVKGKPCESVGRKVNGLTGESPRAAGLPVDVD